MNLSDLEVGKKFTGLVPNRVSEIIFVKFHGDEFAEVTYKDDYGNFGSQMLNSDQLEELNLLEVSSQWKFDASAEDFRLTSEAYRISVAYLFEPYLAVYSSLIEPLPHQISAVYEKMLVQQPLRFVLADDPGAGKTIMAGLLIKELLVRSDVVRCMIVCPGTLVEQWQEELQHKFHLAFEILTRERINLSVNGNAFADVDRAIVGMDVLARNKEFQDKLQTTTWDLIVCDEAHKMSATISGNKTNYTKRFWLGRLLSKITRHFLLMTATPHNGKDEDFHLFMSLVDQDRFEGVERIKGNVDVSDMMRRLVKEDLLTFEGKPLFPERRAYTVSYDLSPVEMELYERVTDYVSDGFNRAERLSGNKKTSVGFAMTILQRRLASSPQAIYKSLERRTERLKKILREKNISAEFAVEALDEEFPSGELEIKEEELAERATAASNLTELRKEIQTLEKLTEMANTVFRSGEDRKWRELSELLQGNENFSRRDKLIIFTEHRDTLNYLQKKISALFGRNEAVVTIHGGLSHGERRKIQERFKADKNIFVLVATDAAGEGINLQNAHLMINYDLPWNPNRLEQRFGRIHRIGQKKICHLWNLVAKDTREGQVFYRLLKKLEEERAALGGKVFDILGKVSFDNKPLRELLVAAIRYGNDPKIIRRLDNIVDKSFDADKLRKILRERALTEDSLRLEKVTDINQTMERVESRKLQPYFIEKFFQTALKRLGGQIYPRVNGRYEIFHVPSDVRQKSPRNQPVAKSYKRVCFDKDKCNIGGAAAELLAPGHPLLMAVSSKVLEKFGGALRQGTIFIDDNDDGKNFRLLFYVEIKIFDGREQVISKRVHFVEILEDGQAVPTSAAPYMDYRSPTDAERRKIFSAIKKAQWLQKNVEERAINYTVKNLMAAYHQEVAAQKKIYLDKLEREVKTRLRSEISFWDTRAVELSAKDKFNAEQATRRANELEARLNQRLAEIALERKISVAAPVVVGGALIVPRGYLPEKNLAARSRVEKIAMAAVMEIERELGNKASDVSGDKCGYDIESAEPSGRLRFIEVKGRNADADTVTVSKNEIITALNSPENFILAIVAVDENAAHVTYLQTPFASQPDFNAVSVNYPISSLKRQGKILLERNISCGGD
ncbi:MAG: DUF3883 domain-containing protein [Selenomonadaceae bacterium]|nr:DUF3883 domain-containing protein [Selenomonadaceae bacterium]